MVHFVAVCVILLLARINAAYEDSRLFDDDPFYPDARSLQELPRKVARSSDAKRRGTSGENFMRFGRSGEDYDFEYDEYESARPTRSGINNSDRFIRFGRDRSNFMRFGRDPQRLPNFLRFGRDSPSEGLNRRKREAGEKRGGNSNFLRFGRGGGDNFMRFGRGDEVTPTTASGDSFRQSEIIERIERQRLLRLLAAINAKQSGNSERLVQL